MNKFKKRLFAAALTGIAIIGIRYCDNNAEQLSIKRGNYLKRELEKEIIKHRRTDLLDDLINFSYNAKKMFDSPYIIPKGFSQEPYDLRIEVKKNERGEAIAYLVNYKNGKKYAILENDIIKSDRKCFDELGNIFWWIYEGINGLYGG